MIVCIGQAEGIVGNWLKPGAVVIDGGMNRVIDMECKKGYRLVGDCDFTSCLAVASCMTPVPGGLGPISIAMLLRNTINSCAWKIQADEWPSSAA